MRVRPQELSVEKLNKNVQTQARETAFESVNISGGRHTAWKHGGVDMDENISGFQPRAGQGEGVSATGLQLATPSAGDARTVRRGVV